MFVPVEDEIAEEAGEILLRTSDLPVGDAIIAATAIKQANGVIYTDDPHFEKIAGIRVLWKK